MKISEAKEMVYGKRENEILYETTIGDYKIVIVNKHGEHPNAYVKVPEKVQDKIILGLVHAYPEEHIFDGHMLEDFIDVNVHGGMTYNGDNIPKGYAYEDSDFDGWWYGWDYNHLGDYACYDIDDPYLNQKLKYEKKWTTDEIIAEALFVVKQIQENYE